MDSYDECRDPPCLHLLDKFDNSGEGSCLTRYSDPTFFRRESARSDEQSMLKVQINRKDHRIKQERSLTKNGKYSRWTSILKGCDRMQFSSAAVDEQTGHDFYQTTQKAQPCLSEVEDAEGSVAALEPISQNGLHRLTGIGFDGSPSFSVNKNMSAPLGSAAKEEKLEATAEIADSDCVLPANIFDISNVHQDNSKTESGDDDLDQSNLYEHHESTVEIGAPNFWTNGSLLGLELSKPADLASSCFPVIKDCMTADLSSNYQKVNISDVCGENDGDRVNYVKSCDSNIMSGDSPNSGSVLSSTITLVAPGRAMEVCPTSEVTHTESGNGSDESFYGVFGGLLFVTSLRKKISLAVYNGKPDGIEQRYHDGKATEKQFEAYSPVCSVPPSSPSHEQMKISSQPVTVNSFVSSTLGLQFADGNINCQENTRDMFASIHLVPEPSFRLEAVCSDSDGDSFCQSSPWMSGVSRDFFSNAEQCESGGTNNEMKEHDGTAVNLHQPKHDRGVQPHKIAQEMRPVDRTESEQNESPRGVCGDEKLMVDGNDDFLVQMRTKSFHRRRIPLPPAKNTITSTNPITAAILKKAIAIRQSVEGTSDAGEDDDCWRSDTS